MARKNEYKADTVYPFSLALSGIGNAEQKKTLTVSAPPLYMEAALHFTMCSSSTLKLPFSKRADVYDGYAVPLACGNRSLFDQNINIHKYRHTICCLTNACGFSANSVSVFFHLKAVRWKPVPGTHEGMLRTAMKRELSVQVYRGA